jgi:hypothetical protein
MQPPDIFQHLYFYKCPVMRNIRLKIPLHGGRLRFSPRLRGTTPCFTSTWRDGFRKPNNLTHSDPFGILVLQNPGLGKIPVLRKIVADVP